MLAGNAGWLSEALDPGSDGRRRRQSAVHLPGYVTEHALAALWAGARFFAFPILFEGFGLPVLEAQSYGVPVMTSTNSSLPEVAGDGALLVDPTDVGRDRRCHAPPQPGRGAAPAPDRGRLCESEALFLGESRPRDAGSAPPGSIYSEIEPTEPPMADNTHSTVKILDVSIDCLDFAATLDQIGAWIDHRTRSWNT